MAKKYIDKSAIVAEIDSLQDATMDENRNFLSSYHEGIFDGLSKIENFLDTLDVLTLDDIKEMENQAFIHGIEVERNKDIDKEIRL